MLFAESKMLFTRDEGEHISKLKATDARQQTFTNTPAVYDSFKVVHDSISEH